VKYIIDHIPRTTPHNRRPGQVMTPQYITIHSTGNPSSTARNERGWLTNPSNTRTASWHICVDEKEAVEAIPLNEVAWHAGDGNGQGNRAHNGRHEPTGGNHQGAGCDDAVPLPSALDEGAGKMKFSKAIVIS
jgi:N-acetylmuramoyl-L-alanine amidase